MAEHKRLYLASRSPRRLELLRQIGVYPEVVTVDVDEAVLPGETPEAYVRRLAIAKARTAPVSWGCPCSRPRNC